MHARHKHLGGIETADEVNRIRYSNDDVPQENPRYDETKSYQETQQVKETQSYEEFGSDSPAKSKAAERKKKSVSHAQAASMVSTAAVVAVVALAVVPGVTIFEPIFGPVFDPIFGGFDDSDDPLADVSAEFVGIEVTDTTVRYSVEVENYDPEYECVVSLTNRFTDRSQTFQSESFSGVEENLKPDMEYTLTLTIDGEVMATSTVTTEREVETYFYLVSAECTCPEDDLFHFEVDIRDGDGAWTSITATLSDLYGNTSEVTISGSGQYAIEVRSAGLIGDTGVLRITCIEDGEERLLHNEEFMI